MSNTGPEILFPIKCASVQLSDLSDVTGFEAEGEVGDVYGFSLNENGVYERAEIDTKKKPTMPYFNQLRDVIVRDAKPDIPYLLKKSNGKWIVIPHLKIDWLIKYTFVSPYVFKTKNNILRKVLNEGSLHVSLSVDKGSFNDIKVLPRDNKYAVLQREGVTKDSLLRFVPEFDLPNAYTLIIDLVLHTKQTMRTFNTRLITGLIISMKIQDPTEQKSRVVISLQKNGDDIVSQSSKQNLIVSASSDTFKKLDVINVNGVEILGFYYVDKALSADELDILMTEDFKI